MNLIITRIITDFQNILIKAQRIKINKFVDRIPPSPI